MTSFLRRLIPLATRSAGSLWKVPSRGIADIPIRRGPFWDMGWPYPFMRPWADTMWDEQQRDYLRRMDRLLRISPWRRHEKSQKTEVDTREYGPNSDVVRVTMDKENLLLEMEFNVTQYDPEDLFVNVTGDWVIVNAQHSIRPDQHGYITRQFTRQILLPEEVEKDTIAGRYTDKGNLVLSVKAKDEESFEKIESQNKKP